MSVQSSEAEKAILTERLIALEVRLAVSREADLLAERADQLLTQVGEGETKLTDAQINGLLEVVNTADKVADILRFLERQGGRRAAWRSYAEPLIRDIRGEIKTRAENIARIVQSQIGDYHRRTGKEVTAISDQRGELPKIQLLLVREFLQSFGIGYLYRFLKKHGGKMEEE